MPYLTSFQLLIIALILNIFIFIKYKNYRNNIFIADLFIIGIGIWMLIYFNFDSRVSSHYHLYPHLIMIVISLSIVIYNTYLLKLISKINFKQNNKIYI